MQQPELRDQCQGRWADIYSAFGLADEKFLSKRNMPCPDCGGTDRFRFCDYDKGFVICNNCMPDGKDGIDYLMTRTKQEFKTIAVEVRRIIGEVQVMSKTDSAANEEQKQQRRALVLKRVWDEGHPITSNDPVDLYFRHRGLITPETSEIRFHSALPYYENQDGDWVLIDKYPAMLAKVRDASGYPATMHCTYLTPDGRKADLSPCRKIKPPSRKWTGGAVRLSTEISDTIVVGEGIETTLAFMQRENLPGWAALSAGNLEVFEPPTGVYVIIAGDNDTNCVGQIAAYKLCQRLVALGIKADVVLPDIVGDWADVTMPEAICR